jgi:hypothetical protein
MANNCYNFVHVTGSAPMIDIFRAKLTHIVKEANLKNERFLFPYVDLDAHDNIQHGNDLEWQDDLIQTPGLCPFNYTTRWNSDPISMFITCYALGVQFEMECEESSCQLSEAYRLTESGVPEYKELTPEEYEACTYPEGYIEDPDDETANEQAEDGAANRRDELLTSKDWLPYDMDLSLLKRKVYEPSTQH